MGRTVDQYYMDLAGDYHREDVVEYLSSKIPSLNRKVRHPSLGHIPSEVCYITCRGVNTLPLYSQVFTE